MRARHLHAVKPKVIAVAVCCGCKEFRPDCQVPNGDGILLMCWICAHHFIDHEQPLHKLLHADCECLPEAVYPESVILKRRATN